MPQDLVTVYFKETGKPALMHSIDAAEAVALGDYAYTAPKGKEPDDKEMAAARAKATGMNATLHPELMTPEERDKTRAAANAVPAQPGMPAAAVAHGESKDPAPGAKK